LWVAPWVKYEKTARRVKSSCFPVWNYQHREAGGGLDQQAGKTTAPPTTDFSLLGWLYDYKFVGESDGKEAPREEYVRARVLWRVMHYERSDGDTALDLFPFITWDKKEDGYRQFSFMWRFLRHERTEDGGRNIDLLFLPLMRKKPKAAE
jgi:hypothetical protein